MNAESSMGSRVLVGDQLWAGIGNPPTDLCLFGLVCPPPKPLLTMDSLGIINTDQVGIVGGGRVAFRRALCGDVAVERGVDMHH